MRPAADDGDPRVLEETAAAPSGQPWRRLSTRVLLAHPRLRVLEDDVALPSGGRTTYLRLEGGAAGVTAIARDPAGLILVQREYAYPTGEWLLQFPGGGANADEAPAAAANRELREEAGLRAERLTSLGWYYLNSRRSDHVMHVFLAEGLAADPLPPDPEEEIESFWMPASEVDALIAAGRVSNAPFLAAWAMFRAHEPDARP